MPKKRRGPTAFQKYARRLRISRGEEPPPKKRKRKQKDLLVDPMLKKMPSIFDTAPVEKKKKKHLS